MGHKKRQGGVVTSVQSLSIPLPIVEVDSTKLHKSSRGGRQRSKKGRKAGI